MKGLVSDFYKRSNAVIASFNVSDSQILNHLHSVFCSSLYGHWIIAISSQLDCYTSDIGNHLCKIPLATIVLLLTVCYFKLTHYRYRKMHSVIYLKS